MKLQKKAYTVFYVLLLINVLLIIVYVIFSNTETINLDLDRGELKNKMEISLKEKANTTYEKLIAYNSDGNLFEDNIGCPKNIFVEVGTASGNVDSTMQITDKKPECVFSFESQTGTISFSDENYNSFSGGVVEYNSNTGSINYISPNYNSNFVTSGTGNLSFLDSGVISDFIDDNLNNDDLNGRFFQSGAVFSPANYIDNDLDFELSKIGTVSGSGYQNIFWSNKELRDFLDGKENSFSGVYETNDANMTIAFTGSSLNYDIKLYTLDKDSKVVKVTHVSEMKNETGTGKTLPNSGDLDFTANDYAIFLKNNSASGALYYELKAKNGTNKNVYVETVKSNSGTSVDIFENNLLEENGKLIGKSKTFSYNFPTITPIPTLGTPKTCLEIKNSDPASLDGYYYIYLNGVSPTLVWCDMTSNGGGWTRYVNIKGNYTFADAKSCWLGNNIYNSDLECFNPNRFAIDAAQLMNKDWTGGKYIFDIPSANVGADVDTRTSLSSYRCLGNSEYMTIMRGGGNEPISDTSYTDWVWLGKNYCNYSRDVGSIHTGSTYMNYDILRTGNTIFGRERTNSTLHNREPTARKTQLFFRETNPTLQTNIINYASGKRWSDGTYARDCNAYKNPTSGYIYSGNTGDGMYYIDPDGEGGNSEFLVYCDMTTDGGGWTLVWKNYGGPGATGINTPALISSTDIQYNGIVQPFGFGGEGFRSIKNPTLYNYFENQIGIDILKTINAYENSDSSEKIVNYTDGTLAISTPISAILDLGNNVNFSTIMNATSNITLNNQVSLTLNGNSYGQTDTLLYSLTAVNWGSLGFANNSLVNNQVGQTSTNLMNNSYARHFIYYTNLNGQNAVRCQITCWDGSEDFKIETAWYYR